MKLRALVAGLIMLAGCEDAAISPANSPGLRVEAGDCESGLPKQATKSARVLYAGKDSLGFVFNTVLTCESQAVFKSELKTPEILGLSVLDVGDSRSRCVCQKDLTVELEAMSGEDYSSVRTLVFMEDTFDLAFPE